MHGVLIVRLSEEGDPRKAASLAATLKAECRIADWRLDPLAAGSGHRSEA